MPIYCDESGGLNAGVMTFATVQIDADAAKNVLDTFREATGLRGEMKGSRISIAERGLAIELIMQHGGQAWIAEARTATLGKYAASGALIEDIHLYAKLLQTAIRQWMLQVVGGCLDVVIDEGRYDARLMGIIEADIQTYLGQWGKTSQANSARSDGVQIADVVANCFFNLGIGSARATGIHAILAPHLANQRLREIQVTTL
jgi:hypothetical protein